MGFLSGIAGGIAGSAVDFVGNILQQGEDKRAQARQQAADLASAREQMDFQRTENRAAEAFAERMSNTAVQRGAADMEAAGFNRILAATGNGASSPSGSTSGGASISTSTPPSKNLTEGVASSAVDILRLKKEISEADSRISLNKANEAAIKAGIPKKEVIGEGYKAAKGAIDKVKSSVRPGYFDAWKSTMKNMFKRRAP